LQVKARSSTNIQVLTAVNYSEPISQAEYATWKDVVEKQAVDVSVLSILVANKLSIHMCYYLLSCTKETQ
jgi:hypothetical protein